ncbi:putative sulfate exporter family transporter [Streptomyces violaceusniger]|uniref:YeiH family protein n=1 Tax=Streptomyces violaceusniger TaxID=68280 RepID=UPI00341DB5A4
MPKETETPRRPPAMPVAQSEPSALVPRLPGLALASSIAGAATVVGRLFPIVGGPVTGIVLGILLAAVLKPGARLRPGISTASGFLLQVAVVVLGSQLSLVQIVRVGISSLPVMVGTLVVCLAAAYWIGRGLGIVDDLRTLIGVGTGICGASAIAAVTPVIGAAGVEVSYAVSTIFLFNIAAVLAFPFLGHLLGMHQHAFGLFAGTAVNDMSSVVAAATTYGAPAADYAVVVKLTRTLMIIPICLGLTILASRRTRTAPAGTTPHARPRTRVVELVPRFLVGFLLAAAVNTTGLIPDGAHHALGEISVFLITTALSAIGLSTDLVGLRRAGFRPLILGGFLWMVVSITSLALQLATGSL